MQENPGSAPENPANISTSIDTLYNHIKSVLISLSTLEHHVKILNNSIISEGDKENINEFAIVINSQLNKIAEENARLIARDPNNPTLQIISGLLDEAERGLEKIPVYS